MIGSKRDAGGSEEQRGLGSSGGGILGHRADERGLPWKKKTVRSLGGTDQQKRQKGFMWVLFLLNVIRW